MAPSDDTMFVPYMASGPGQLLPNFYSIPQVMSAATPAPAAAADWEVCVDTAKDFDEWLQETFVEEEKPQQQQQQQEGLLLTSSSSSKRAAPIMEGVQQTAQEHARPLKRMKMTPEYLAKVVSKIDSRISKLQGIKQQLLSSASTTTTSSATSSSSTGDCPRSCISPETTTLPARPATGTGAFSAFSAVQQQSQGPTSAPRVTSAAAAPMAAAPVSPERKTSLTTLPSSSWNTSTMHKLRTPSIVSAASSSVSISNGSSCSDDSEADGSTEDIHHQQQQQQSKVNRRAQNRVSAKRSRLKKKQHMDQMQNCLEELKIENQKLKQFVEGKLGVSTTKSMVKAQLAQKAAKGQTGLVTLLQASSSRHVSSEALVLLRNLSKTVASTS